MTRTEAIKQATEIANKDRITMAVVLEGPHRDEGEPADSHGYCPAEAVLTLYKYGTTTDIIEPLPVQEEIGRWKVMPCPEHGGKHTFHDHRYIVTNDAEILVSDTDKGNWWLLKGEIICVMRDGPPERAHLVAAAPVMRDTLRKIRVQLEMGLYLKDPEMQKVMLASVVRALKGGAP